MPMKLRSPAFASGETVPVDHTCDGADRSPPLEWSDLPEGTVTLVVTCDDPDAPRGLFRHWSAYDIPADRSALAAGAADFPRAINDFGKPGYGGPCPPKGDGPHRYRFTLRALSGRIGAADASLRAAEIEAKAAPLVLATAAITGLYGR